MSLDKNVFTDSYKFEYLSKKPFEQYEFGVPHYRGISFYKIDDDLIVVGYEGNRIVEFCRDGQAKFWLGNRAPTNGLKLRWGYMLADNVEISVETRKNAKGEVSYVFSVGTKLNNRWAWGKYALRPGTFGFHRNADKTIGMHQISASAAPTKKKDNAKYRVFGVELKKLRAVLIGQVKLGVYDEHAESRYWDLLQNLEGYFDRTKTAHISWKDKEDKLDELVHTWMVTKNHQLAPGIMLFCLALHPTTHTSDTRKALLRRINNGLRAVQTRYLRKHCLTIVDSDNSLSRSNDQDCELLSNDGLREVQVPSEAQVC